MGALEDDVAEFLKRLRARAEVYRHQHRLDPLLPRRKRPGFCPVTALAWVERGFIFPMGNWHAACAVLNFKRTDDLQIISAADGRYCAPIPRSESSLERSCNGWTRPRLQY